MAALASGEAAEQKMKTVPEIVFVDKPKGITSFDVIRKLRKKFGAHPHTKRQVAQSVKSKFNACRYGVGVKKIGHAGTLDPFATGLLIVGVGKGTKRLNEYTALPKTYVMDVLLGKSTDTGDPEGMTLEEKKVIFSHSRESENKECAEKISLEQVKKILEKMEGEIELPIPKYSAVKHKGIPLYAYARKNIPVEEKFRTTKIFYLKLLGIEPQKKNVILRIEMKCEKGTYARAVAEEIGRRLGVPAMLRELRRTKIGDIDVNGAQRLENDIIIRMP